MSEQNKPGGLGDLIGKIKSGAATIAASTKKPRRDAGTDADADNVEVIESQDAPRPHIDDYNDPLLIDPQDQAVPAKPDPKKMSLKKKLVLGAVVVALGVMAKNGIFTPVAIHQSPPETHPSTADASAHEDKPSLPQMHDGGLTAGLPTALGEQAVVDPAIGKTLDELQLDGQLQKPLVASGKTVSAQDSGSIPADGFGFPAQLANEPPPLEIGATASQPKEQLPLPSGANSPFAAAPEVAPEPITAGSGSPFGEMPVGGETPPKLASLSAEKHDPVLGSTSLQNPDSSQKPSLQKDAADVTKMKAQLAQKDNEIKSLKDQLAKKPGSNIKPAQAKPAVAHNPKHSARVAQRSPTKAVPPVAKVVSRPKLCVKAVAPPARNCTTCVAHAFVVDAGAENMVGQGDFLDGYRVAITGDRLDLQNSDGQVVHKFWSSPNGCPSI
ncbi:hypothetical protein P5706_36800 [Pseudomonas sp. ChxA]|jgi:hypothetical protein|uniref:hypothetical protein n=1 Tax=Pseudomonas TaxID=286 RepID=UPI0012907595|nr:MULTISPECIES: hypothetical protein [Pseudomonas]MBF6043488.1 hypothetical protein [Pseudomonas mucoides]MBJ2202710.1 hypothetical protein [Pseudomonas carnis]MDL2189737.1 hypothetical protein [Pseudomonas sp. ChxA]WHT75509.1 hypothetical protein QMY54_00242 [Pseudomonas rhodesiae]